MTNILNFLHNLLTPNRIAALATWLTGLSAFILGIAHTLPGTWANYALIAAGLLTKVVTTLKFLDGSQKWDAIQATVTPKVAASSLPTDEEEEGEGPDKLDPPVVNQAGANVPEIKAVA